MLKLGYSLIEPIHTETIAGLEVRKVGESGDDNAVLAISTRTPSPHGNNCGRW